MLIAAAVNNIEFVLGVLEIDTVSNASTVCLTLSGENNNLNIGNEMMKS